MMPRVTNVPAVVEREIVDVIVHWIDLVAVLLTSETARQRLQQDVFEQLHAGTIATERVVAAADAGTAFADAALRQYAAEFIDQGREVGTACTSASLCSAVVVASAGRLSARPQPR